MGNCCSGKKDDLSEVQLAKLVKLQNAVRTFHAKLQLVKMREKKMQSLFGTVLNLLNIYLIRHNR